MTIKTTALRLLGAALASGLGNTIVKSVVCTEARSARHLRDLDGSVYMRRWHVIREGSFASRVLEKLTGYSSIRLHHLLRGDHDRDLHNHPFTYRTFILDGSYAEEFKAARRQPLDFRFPAAGDTVQHGPDAFHRIDRVSEGGVWTLFAMTRNTREWGFLSKGRFVPSTRYLKTKGYR